MENKANGRIERYLIGQMDPNEQKSFEHEMNTNPNLNQAVEEHKLLIDAIKVRGKADLKQRLQNLDASEDAPSTRKAAKLKLFLFGLLIGLTGIFLMWWWYPSSKVEKSKFPNTSPEIPIEQPAEKIEQNLEPVVLVPKPQVPKNQNEDPKQKSVGKKSASRSANPPQNSQVIAAAFEPYMHPSIEPGVRGGDAQRSHLEQFQSAYIAKQFKEVVSLYENLSETEKRTAQTQFLYANALMAEHAYQEAANALEHVLISSVKRFKEPAEWYHALCQAQLTEFLDISELKAISTNQKHAYYQNAILLLDKKD